MSSLLYIIFQIIVFILLAPLVNGIIKKIKALTQKRKGAPLLQLYFDIFKLLKKDVVVSDTTSWIFRATPYIVLSTALAGAVLVPVIICNSHTGFVGDAILLAYLLALGRFFMTLSGLDAGSTFGGMGSSREVMISALIEPSLIITIFTAGLIAKSTSVFDMMSTAAGNGGIFSNPIYIFLFLTVFIIILAETSRIPVDDPATHLELTMVHEAMILEYSGRHLAMMELAASVKQLIYISLLVNMFLPSVDVTVGGGLLPTVAVSLLVYIAKVIGTAIIVAVAEVSTVKLKLFSVPNLAALSFILAFIGFVQYFVIGR
ncbi:MAG: NADH-quinone oxidoreductase subunit H [Bacillota bacterium]|nr:NADH-quinone oxidoreductase subunit H [Bacillota bacterium]